MIKLHHPIDKNKIREINTSGFNLGGLIFGPLMYMGWGMWKKGMLLFGVMLLLFIIQDVLFATAGLVNSQSILGLVVMFYSAFAINKDNYNHLLSKGWKPVDKKVKLDTNDSNEKKRFPIVWIVVAILVVFAFFSWIGESNQDTQWSAEKSKRIAECEEMYGGGKYCECTIDYLEKKVGIQGIVEINNKFKTDKKIPPIIVEAGQSCQQYFDETNIDKVNQLMEESGVELE
jgi:hypothetical protein